MDKDKRKVLNTIDDYLYIVYDGCYKALSVELRQKVAKVGNKIIQMVFDGYDE